ncbi:MAG TPA: hypothetical protein VK453_06035 [Micromonosporaceae bacterium]|nr:hypothetical protein [Micromonosporaceae bacterium]
MSIRQSAPGGSYRPPHGYGPVPPGQGTPPTQGAPQPPQPPQPPPSGHRASSGRRPLLIGLAVVAALGLLVMGFAAVRYFGADPAPQAQDKGTNKVITGEVGALTEATLDIVTSASALDLKAADLGNDLYRVETPSGGSLVPEMDVNGGNLQLRLLPSGNNAGPGSVTVRINSKVVWSLKLTGGAAEEIADLRAAKLKSLDVTGGGQKIEITLPPVTGTFTVNMTGGAAQFLLHAPKDIPVKVRLGQGAGDVSVDGKAQKSVAGGTVINPPGWDGAKDRIDLNATSGASEIKVDRF